MDLKVRMFSLWYIYEYPHHYFVLPSVDQLFEMVKFKMASSFFVWITVEP